MSLPSTARTLLALAVVSSSLGCAAVAELFRNPQDAVAPLITPDPLYEELVTHYVELCAVSQYRPLNGKLGGIPGHAVMYLKGACRDESSPYPRLRACRHASTDRADPEHGAGVRWTDVVRGEEFRRNRAVYYEYIERARDGVVAASERLAELEGIREELYREVYEKWKARNP